MDLPIYDLFYKNTLFSLLWAFFSHQEVEKSSKVTMYFSIGLFQVGIKQI